MTQLTFLTGALTKKAHLSDVLVANAWNILVVLYSMNLDDYD
jgi:hypothetical protein